MKIKAIFLDWIGKRLLDEEVWSRAKSLVQTASGFTELTGEEKRARVRQDLLFFSSSLVSSVLNLAIELGVAMLKAQQDK